MATTATSFVFHIRVWQLPCPWHAFQVSHGQRRMQQIVWCIAQCTVPADSCWRVLPGLRACRRCCGTTAHCLARWVRLPPERLCGSWPRHRRQEASRRQRKQLSTDVGQRIRQGTFPPPLPQTYCCRTGLASFPVCPVHAFGTLQFILRLYFRSSKRMRRDGKASPIEGCGSAAHGLLRVLH